MPLSENLKSELKQKLMDGKKRIESELSRFAKPTETPGDYKTKFEDLGTDTDENASEVEEYADNLALENTLEKQLMEITEALSRMEKGTYGVCENCGSEIGVERLRAYPAARSCIKCK